MGAEIILREQEEREIHQVEVERERFLEILDVLKEDSEHLCKVIGCAKDAKQIFLLKDNKILRFEYAETLVFSQEKELTVDDATIFIVDAFLREKK